MNEATRLDTARTAVQAAARLMTLAADALDPVARRRLQVQAARLLRAAADALDDHGRLTE